MGFITADVITSDGRTRLLPDGTGMPLLGLGVWQATDGQDCVNAVRWALDLGYRHLDTAQDYGNEASVGRALLDSRVPREEVFITTKFQPSRKDPLAELEDSLRRLGTDYVDLYLVHWPEGGPVWAWPGMEAARARGLAGSIGVSNFDANELRQVIAVGEIVPAVNQVQFSPRFYRPRLLDECLRLGTALEAYSPLGTGRHLTDAVVTSIADRVGRTPAQVMLRWCLQHGVPVIPKSTHFERIKENAQIFDFSLPSNAMLELNELDAFSATDTAVEQKWW